ncbi:hypothetical protein DDB_G0276823 [Dictyostelium discoideum AX4]|uniref:Transmembrane protein n=1 Tax=Dictyostelium discoideum TaxID=44689 RepID=Q7KWL7_DICDI|nr:hypothetical protein DDB_G0276823 [Dictyostelium discoideum AX4]EAL68913.1 hypothetical protein DDB_G0276823 [Dictyostelium discoideum AX4]|eukprot:XP_642908.1 hypothetical protein DDB_G0276823 [Dictyostelium discoideum AX4]
MKQQQYLLLSPILIIILFINIIKGGYVSIQYFNNDQCDQVNFINYFLEGSCVQEQVMKCNSDKSMIEYNIYESCSGNQEPIGTKQIPTNTSCETSAAIYSCIDELPNLSPSADENNFVTTVIFNGSDCYNYNINNIQYVEQQPTGQCDYDGAFGSIITCTPTKFIKQRYEGSNFCINPPTNNYTYTLPINDCSFNGYNIIQFCNSPSSSS